MFINGLRRWGDGGRRSDEGERGAEDFVARTDPGQTESEMERRRARGNGDGMFRTDEDGEIFFESVEIRTRRRDPIGLEGFQDVFDFGGADVRRGEVDAGKRHWF